SAARLAWCFAARAALRRSATSFFDGFVLARLRSGLGGRSPFSLACHLASFSSVHVMLLMGARLLPSFWIFPPSERYAFTARAMASRSAALCSDKGVIIHSVTYWAGDLAVSGLAT